MRIVNLVAMSTVLLDCCGCMSFSPSDPRQPTLPSPPEKTIAQLPEMQSESIRLDLTTLVGQPKAVADAVLNAPSASQHKKRADGTEFDVCSYGQEGEGRYVIIVFEANQPKSIWYQPSEADPNPLRLAHWAGLRNLPKTWDRETKDGVVWNDVNISGTSAREIWVCRSSANGQFNSVEIDVK